jgi:hypothetical protein
MQLDSPHQVFFSILLSLPPFASVLLFLSGSCPCSELAERHDDGGRER